MTTILIVSKKGSIKELKVKNLSRDILHKKCNFKNNNNFLKLTEWNVKINGNNIFVELWGKNNGRAGSENKYDFPPPVDNTLLFGNCALIQKNENNELIDLKKSVWKKMYEKLFGGFEDLDTEEEKSEDELESIPAEYKSKDGYLLDGFIVNSDDTDESCDENIILSNENDSDDNLDDDDNDDDGDDNDDDDEENSIDNNTNEEHDDNNSEDDDNNSEDDDDDSDYDTDVSDDDSDVIGSELSEEDYEYSDDE